MTSFDHDKEEDEGYLAAGDGKSLSENPHPRGTIRYAEWRSGWHIRHAETLKKEDDGYQAAGDGKSLSENPYPRGTIRYAEWRSGWHIKRAEIQRSIRLAARYGVE
jgi:ribosome modulation factor